MQFAGKICFGKPSKDIDPVRNRFIKSSKKSFKFCCLSLVRSQTCTVFSCHLSESIQRLLTTRIQSYVSYHSLLHNTAQVCYNKRTFNKLE